MHTNHRRKTPKARNNLKPRWWTKLRPYKQIYWTRERARERMILVAGRYDDFQDVHPKSVLWDAL